RSRSNSRMPRTSSIWATWVLRDGCETLQHSDAFRKLRASATATAYWSCRSVKGCGANCIGRNYHIHPDNVLDISGDRGQHGLRFGPHRRIRTPERKETHVERNEVPVQSRGWRWSVEP